VCLTKQQFAMNDKCYRTVFNVTGIESQAKMHDILTHKQNNEMYILLEIAARTHTTFISIAMGGGYMLSPLLVE